jgi:hypothetical protein
MLRFVTLAFAFLLALPTLAPAPALADPAYLPVTGDFDGDGILDLGVFVPASGTWLISLSSLTPEPVSTCVSCAFAVQWGAPTDVPVPADYNGDGVADIAVFRPTEGAFYVLLAGPFPAVGGMIFR